MDWKIFIATFGTVFLAELGDKTQIAAIMMAAQSQKPWIVFLGAALALVLITLLGVILAQALTQALPLQLIRKIAGLGFLLLGALILVNVL